MSTAPHWNSEFSRLRDVCYLDHAGTALYSDSQIEAVCEYMKGNLLGNPHSSNLSSRYCHDAVGQIRYRILKYFHTNENEYSVVFTAGTTSGLKTVVDWFDWGENDDGTKQGQFVYLRDAHTSVLGLREIASERGAKIKCLEHEDAFARFRTASPYHGEISRVNETFGNSLFVFPAMCNFSGCKYPLSWVEKLRTTKVMDDILAETRDAKRNFSYQWFSLLDASSFVPTNSLKLDVVQPDFVVFSFYKIFGYPTGLGALLVRKSSEFVLKKSYYGGGTILMALSDEKEYIRRPTFHEWCEDGTINYLSVLSLRHGFDTLERLGGTMENISEKVFLLTKYLHEKLTNLHHSTGQKVVKIYRDTDYNNPTTQGGIVNFNLIRPDGTYVGYLEVMQIANSYGIHLRTGCFCNPGACQRHLRLTNAQLVDNYGKGHTCADNIDLIDGYPTGSIRVSFGYSSTEADADFLMKMILECFVLQPVILKTPHDWLQESYELRKKFCEDEFGFKTDEGTIASKWSSTRAKLKNIYIYPIKSCGPFNVQKSWCLTKNGLKYDREWMIVSEDSVVLTQKQLPRMCLIIPVIDTKNEMMFLNFQNSSISVPLDNESAIRSTISVQQSKVCEDKVTVIDCGDEVSNWLATKLDKPNIRLVKLLTRNKKKCDFPRDLSLVNQAQYLLITECSVQWLRELIPRSIDSSVEILSKRFRSNFVIDGNFEASEEFAWDRVRIGNCLFEVEGPCTRCQMICINQLSGERNREPLTALSAAMKGRIQFGIYLRLNFDKTLAVLNLDDDVVPIFKNKG